MKVTCCDRCLAEKQVTKYAVLIYRCRGMQALNYCRECAAEAPPKSADDHSEMSLKAYQGHYAMQSRELDAHRAEKAGRMCKVVG